MPSCFQQTYHCPFDGCSESYNELSPGCTLNGHAKFDPECARLNPYLPSEPAVKIQCPRHAGEDWEHAPPFRRGPYGGPMVSSTDIIPKYDRLAQFSRAEEQEKRKRLNEAPQVQSHLNVQRQAIGGNLREQQDTATGSLGNQSLPDHRPASVLGFFIV